MKRTAFLISILTVSFAMLFLSGCEEKDLGRYCVVGFDSSTGSGVKAINSEAPECLDRICVLQTQIVTIDDATSLETAQYCSQKCSDDGGCKDPDKAVNCTQGFLCIRLGQESDDLNGQCICECRDYLSPVDICFKRCSLGNATSDEECDRTK
jgi:hypothetical protein